MALSRYKIYSISWNLTQRCNLRCSHCYLDASYLKDEWVRELKTEECIRVIDQIAEINPNSVLILTGGEPLLRRDLFEIMDYATKRGFMVVLGTNGTLLDQEIAERLGEHGVKGVGISLDSLRPQLHDSFRGMEGAWERTLYGIEVLKKAKIEFLIQTTVTQKNYREIPDLIRFSQRQGARGFYLFFLVCTGRGQALTDISPYQYEKILEQLFEKDQDGSMLIAPKCAPHYRRIAYQKDPSSPLIKAYEGGCPAGTHYCRITPEGDITPCPYLPIKAGSLLEKSFAEIWEGAEIFQRLRSRNLQGRCGQCVFRNLCSGCRARAYAYSGNVLGEDPWCLYHPGQDTAREVVLKKDYTLGMEVQYELPWQEEAKARLERIPSFARGMAIKSIEEYARERSYSLVTPEIMREAREELMRSGRSMMSFS